MVGKAAAIGSADERAILHPARSAPRVIEGYSPVNVTRATTAPRQPSRFLLRFFDIYLSLYVPLHFNALRLASPERFPVHARPLIVCINHPSWWDPLTSVLISRFLLRQAGHYAPMDAKSLPRHRILAGLGLFPVEQGTPRGAAQFLRAAQHVLADPNAVLWLTPQGGFTDARERPALFKAGLGSLIKRLDHVTVLPIAYEYTFWDERRPEILAQCGKPLTFTHGRLDGAITPDHSSGDLPLNLKRDARVDPGASIATALAATQDELATRAATRDAGCFVTVMAGHVGVSGLCAMSRNVHAAIRATPFEADPAQRSVPSSR